MVKQFIHGKKSRDMDNMFYTDERNAQIVISLLKANNIRNIITSPGTTHMCFVGSVQHDSFFNVYSCVDERSAAYMACGMAAESGEPVVVTCTGATASRNYYSALTEAYYRKLPVIAITAHQGTDRLGHLWEQNIDRRRLPYDIVKLSVEAIYVDNPRNEHYCMIEVNKAILESKRHGGGPVHINLFTRYSRNFSIKELPPVQVIARYTGYQELPAMREGRKAIFIGSHKPFTKRETEIIDKFCAAHDAVVFCDKTSGYNGSYKVNFALCLAQQFMETELSHVDLLIHIGEVSGDGTYNKFKCKEVWRVNEDGEIRDTFGKLSAVFEMPESFFFEKYSTKNAWLHYYYDACVSICEDIEAQIPDLPLSTIWVARQLAHDLPNECNFHMGIWSCLRAFNYFVTPDNTVGNCNVGGFGIDGNVSSLLGASLCKPDKLYIGIVGDLAFFYDMNTLGNRHVGNNFRLMVINNGRGNEMRYSFSPAASLGEDGKLYLAASGHFGEQSKSLLRHYAEDLGYEYISAFTKEDFLTQKNHFLTEKPLGKPVIFEVFIAEEEDEEQAYQLLTTTGKDGVLALKRRIKSVVKDIVGERSINSVKKFIKK